MHVIVYSSALYKHNNNKRVEMSTKVENTAEILRDFLNVIAGPLPDDTQYIASMLRGNVGDAKGWPPRTLNEVVAMVEAGVHDCAYYISTASARPDSTGKYRNKKAQFDQLNMVILDDVGSGEGSKANEGTLRPTYKIETSKDNYQWGYLLDPPVRDFDIASTFIKAVYGSGISDKGGSLTGKFVRLPAGVNGKDKGTGRNTFPVRLTELNEGVSYSIEELIDEWELNLSADEPGQMQSTDPVMDWLIDNNHVKGPIEDVPFITIACPWGDTHSRGGDRLAGYTPLGHGEDPATRGFHCFHEHCADKHTKDLLDWVGESGGPTISNTEFFKLTDTGNSERFIRDHATNLRFNLTSGCWHRWNGMYWEASAESHVHGMAVSTTRNMHKEAGRTLNKDAQKAILAHAHKSESLSALIAMKRGASLTPSISIHTTDLDRQPMTLNLLNGTLDLTTGKLRDHDRNDLMAGVLPFNYDPKAKSERWEAFISSVFDHDKALISYVQRIIGYTLSDDISEQCLFFCYGKGSNGKSTLFNIIGYLLGHHASRTEVTSLLTSKNRDAASLGPMKARIMNKRCVITSELPEGQSLSEAAIKDLTGSDLITGRELFERSFDFKPTHKLWMYGNHKPRIRGTDDGIWRRIHLIPFTQHFEGKDRVKGLDDLIITEDIEAVFAWAVKGCLSWQKKGLATPPVVTRATAKYRADEDTMGEFITQTIVRDDTCNVAQVDMYTRYKMWATENGYRPKGRNTFNTDIEDRGFMRKRGANGVVWVNITLTAPNYGVQ